MANLATRGDRQLVRDGRAQRVPRGALLPREWQSLGSLRSQPRTLPACSHAQSSLVGAGSSRDIKAEIAKIPNDGVSRDAETRFFEKLPVGVARSGERANIGLGCWTLLRVPKRVKLTSDEAIPVSHVCEVAWLCSALIQSTVAILFPLASAIMRSGFAHPSVVEISVEI